MAVATRVVVIEDDPTYRRGLEALIAHAPDFELLTSFALISDAMAAARAGVAGWGLVLVDLHLPDGSGIDGIRKLKALRADLPVIALTVFEAPNVVVETICAGADGYLLKRATFSEVLGAMRVAISGGSPLTPATARTLLDVVRVQSTPQALSPSRLDLTEREREVLRSLAAGNAYKQVAADLGLSIDTIRTHVRGLYRKLQVHSVAEAVLRALREGLV
jgi:two-component system nitrate/nitrite response regulator NarL